MDNKQFWQELMNYQRIGISLHVMPDGDSFASSVALARVLQQLGKQVTVVSPDDGLYFFDDYDKSVVYGKSLENYDQLDCILLPDGNSLDRFHLTSGHSTIFCIDHHEQHTEFAHYALIQPNACATCAMIYDMLVENGVPISKDVATLLLLGVCTDTGFFSHPSVAYQGMYYAQQLIQCNADYPSILTLQKTPFKLRQYEAYVIDHFVVNQQYGYCIVPRGVVEELGLSPAEIRHATPVLTSIREVSVAFLLVEHATGFKGSLRSSPAFDIEPVARMLGGGGHKNAAAFNLENMSAQEAIKTVENALQTLF